MNETPYNRHGIIPKRNHSVPGTFGNLIYEVVGADIIVDGGSLLVDVMPKPKPKASNSSNTTLQIVSYILVGNFALDLTYSDQSTIIQYNATEPVPSTATSRDVMNSSPVIEYGSGWEVSFASESSAFLPGSVFHSTTLTNTTLHLHFQGVC